MLKLRPFNFSPEDYEAVASIHNSSFADSRRLAQDYKRIDDYTPQDEYDWERMMAEWNGRVIGYGLYTRSLWLSEPDLYTIGWLTHPDFRNRGACSAFWKYLEGEVLPARPHVTGLIAETRSDVPSRPFLENRGFDHTMTTATTQLDLASFDASKYADLTASIAARGIELKPLSWLIANDPDHMTKLVALGNVQRADEPTVEQQAPLEEEMFRNYYMSSETSYYPDGWFIAVHNGQYVGWCAVLPNVTRPEIVSNGITVIAREYRRIGLATAMKVHVIEHAKTTMGATAIRTSNVSTNPMLQINLKLGYTPQLETYEYKKMLVS